MATVAPWRIALRLHITLTLLTAASAIGSALFLMYLARPYIGAQLPEQSAASGEALLLGAVVAGVLAALLGLGFGVVTSRRIRELIRQTEVLVHTDAPYVPRPAADELGVLEDAFGRLTLSIDRFVRDSAILSCLAQGMLLIGRDGALVDYNTAAEGILGAALAPYAGQVIWGQDGLCPEAPDNGRLKDLWQQALDRAEPIAGGEMPIRLGLASARAWRLLEVSLQRWQGGKEAGVLIIFQDASEKQRIREQIRKADQLAFLGGLAAQFSHQVRTPLTMVRGLLELLQADAAPTHSRQDYFDRIIRGLDRLDRLASALLSLAQPTPDAQEAMHLPRLLDDGLTLADGVKRETINVKTDYAASLPTVLGDPYLLSEALSNIIQNAIEATPPGGEVTIQARPMPRQAGLAMDAAGVRVRITNTGSGVSEELRERIFEPFFSTKPSGTGLGLTIARRLIESHGGRIAIESDGASWTSFVVELP